VLIKQNGLFTFIKLGALIIKRLHGTYYVTPVTTIDKFMKSTFENKSWPCFHPIAIEIGHIRVTRL
jgi:hypothetical protein